MEEGKSILQMKAMDFLRWMEARADRLGVKPNGVAALLRYMEHDDPEERETARRLFADFETQFGIAVDAFLGETLSQEQVERLIEKLIRPELNRMMEWSSTRVRPCENCGDLFFPERSTGRFCSDRCRKAAQRKKVRLNSDMLTLA